MNLEACFQMLIKVYKDADSEFSIFNIMCYSQIGYKWYHVFNRKGIYYKPSYVLFITERQGCVGVFV